MANYVYIATSIDGFIATPEGGVEWLDEIPNPDNSDFGFSEFMKGIDAILMGRGTFEKVVSFGVWPYEKPVYVMSNTLNSVPKNLTKKAQILNGTIAKILSTLSVRGANNLYIDGGKVIQSFLKEDLIDEMIITRVPVLLGRGIPLFGELDDAKKFSHKNTEIINNTLVKSYYSRERIKN